MKEKLSYIHHPKVVFCMHTLGVLLLTILLSQLVVYLSAMSFLSPVSSDSDFALSDMYCRVLDHRAVKHKTDIVVVGIDGMSRSEVGDLIEQINVGNPATIGVDVLFPFVQDNDAVLVEQIESCPNIVLASQLCYFQDEDRFASMHGSYFEDNLLATFGAVNMPISRISDVVRDYRPSFPVDDQMVLSFPMAIVNQVNPTLARRVTDRQTTTEKIDFPSKEIQIVSGKELMESKDMVDWTGEIVLLGDLNSHHDTYITPIDDHMPGVMVHAYAISTILSDTYIRSSKPWFNALLAIVLCLLFAMCNLWGQWHMTYMGNFCMRVMQFAVLFVLLWVGTICYADYHYYLDFSLSILYIGLGALSFDIWYGLVAMYRFLRKNIYQKLIRK